MTEDKETSEIKSNNDSAIVPKAESKSSTVVQHRKITENVGLNRINLLDENDIAKAEVFLKRMLKTEKGGIKTIEDGLAVIMRAQDLNLPVSTCLEHIHVINGKTGVDIHIIKALLLKAGVTWELTKDYTPLYEYTDGNNVFVEDKLPDYAIKCKSAKDAIAEADVHFKNNPDDLDTIFVYPVRFFQGYDGNIYKDYQLNNNFAIAINKQHAAAIQQQKKIPIYRIAAIPVDYVTEYKFSRNVNGKEIEAVGHFSHNEAVAAGMFEKDTWKKYFRIMSSHRAFTYGAREIASDILFGVMETTELKVVSGQELRKEDIIDIEEVQIIG